MTGDRLVYEETDWLVPGLIPRGEVTLVAGRSGSGKSTLYAAMVAQVTAGVMLDQQTPLPLSRVLYYAREEKANGPLLGRLMAAGASLDRWFLGDTDSLHRPLPPLQLPDQLHQLAVRVQAIRATLVIIDPVKSYLGPGISETDGIALRAILEGLQQIARRECCCILCTWHYRKARTGDPLDWLSGHADVRNTARMVLGLGPDPRDPTKWVLSPLKCSCGGESPPRSYVLDRSQVTPVFRLGPPVDVRPEDLGAQCDDAIDRGQREQCRRWLRAVCDAEDVRAKLLMTQAQAEGLKLRTLERAKLDMGITSHLVGPRGDQYHVWRRPAEWPADYAKLDEAATV